MSKQSTRKMWPTPRVGDVSGGDRTKWALEGKWQTGLREAVNIEEMNLKPASTAWNQLTLLLEDSHVRTYQSQGNELASRKAPGQDSGLNSTESFANYDHATSSWRTSQACLLTGWEEFSETWPQSGTMRSGKCFRQQTLVHPTSEKESSLWLTPSAMDASPMTGGELYQTKTGTVRARYKDNRSSNRGLEAQVMWPTPSATPRGPHTGAKSGSVSKDGRSRTSANGTKWGATLETAAGGQLNPPWVEWLMGFPTGWTELKD